MPDPNNNLNQLHHALGLQKDVLVQLIVSHRLPSMLHLEALQKISQDLIQTGPILTL